MRDSALDIVITKALPALSGESVTYNPAKNVYLTMGHTSLAGNTYYKAVRFSKRLAVFYSLGQGYAHTFLNGITLFCWDGTKAKMIARKSWGGSSYRIFSENDAMNQSILMLKDFLQGQAKLMDRMVNDQLLLECSREMLEETRRRHIGF